MPHDTSDDSSDPYELARQAQARALRRQRAPSRPPQRAALPRLSARQRRGREAEDRAWRHLQAQGLTLLARNLSCRAGEIDLVCLDEGILVFVEVRQRTAGRYGGAAASVSGTKQQRLIRAAAYFLPQLAAGWPDIPACRFDVVALEGPSLIWLRNAFALPAGLG